MRIPITIKIPVNVAGKPSASGLAQVAIKDLGSGLEKITVRILNLKPKGPNTKLQPVKPGGNHQLHWQTMPTRFPVVSQPKPQAATPLPAMAVPRVRYSVKTIHITLTWPTIPSLLGLGRKLTHLSRKALLRIGIAVAAVVIALACLQLFGHHHNHTGKSAPVASSQLPHLTRGTPSYSTVLPAGKTIQQLGGWVRISPPGKSPVYTFVDKIGNVQIDVSEQPLPATFQSNTANEISQLADSYNATDKFTASNNTAVYVASSADGSQSVIFTKNDLLILIKSAQPVNNNQWTAYISSLQ